MKRSIYSRLLRPVQAKLLDPGLEDTRRTSLERPTEDLHSRRQTTRPCREADVSPEAGDLLDIAYEGLRLRSASHHVCYPHQRHTIHVADMGLEHVAAMQVEPQRHRGRCGRLAEKILAYGIRTLAIVVEEIELERHAPANPRIPQPAAALSHDLRKLRLHRERDSVRLRIKYLEGKVGAEFVDRDQSGCERAARLFSFAIGQLQRLPHDPCTVIQRKSICRKSIRIIDRLACRHNDCSRATQRHDLHPGIARNRNLGSDLPGHARKERQTHNALLARSQRRA